MPFPYGVVGKAIATLHQVGEIPEGDGTDLPPLKVVKPSQLAWSLSAVYKKLGASAPGLTDTTVVYASSLAANLMSAKNFDFRSGEPLLLNCPSLLLILILSVTSEWAVRSASSGDDDEDCVTASSPSLTVRRSFSTLPPFVSNVVTVMVFVERMVLASPPSLGYHRR